MSLGEGQPDLVRDGRAASSIPWVLTTYFAEGLPYSLVHQVSAQFFTAVGASIEAVGLTSLYGLAWNLKFLWSPLVDRFGTLRGWVLGCQVALAALVALIAWPSGLGSVGTVARLFACVAFVAATHDVAVDGFYMAALGKKDQAELTGLRIAAYRVALIAGQGGLVALAGLTSFRVCFYVAACVLALLAMLHARVLPKAARSEKPPQGLGFVDSVVTFLEKDRALKAIAFLMLFRAGDALMFAMNAPFLQSLGLDLGRRGLVQGLGGGVASIIGALWGGHFIAKRGLRATLVPIALAQSLAILFYVALAFARPSAPIVVVGVLAEQLVAGVGSSALAVFILRRSAGQFKASHAAFCTALMSLATTFVGTPSGYLASRVGFPLFFAVAFLASIPGVLLARMVPTEVDAEAV